MTSLSEITSYSGSELQPNPVTDLSPEEEKEAWHHGRQFKFFVVVFVSR